MNPQTDPRNPAVAPPGNPKAEPLVARFLVSPENTTESVGRELWRTTLSPVELPRTSLTYLSSGERVWVSSVELAT
eukprot:14974582-Alexandrium_andersonii.AAC.1